MDNNETQHPRIRKQSRLQDNRAFADKTGSVNWNAKFHAPGQQLASMRCESFASIDADATAPQGRESAQNVGDLRACVSTDSEV